MKKLISLLISLLMILTMTMALTACDLSAVLPMGSGSSNNNNTDPHYTRVLTETECYERWHKLVGYWNAAEGRFAVPDMEDSHSAAFRYGMWATEFGTDYGRVTELTATGEQELTALVEWTSGEPAELTVIIDYSGLDRDGKIRIKIGQEDWLQYMYAGATSAEAFQTYLDNNLES